MNDYEKNELKAYLQDYCDSVLEQTNKPNWYFCPFCDSGRHEHHTPAFHLFPDSDGVFRHYKCQSCGAFGDLYTLLMWNENLTFSQALERAQQLYGTPCSNAEFAQVVASQTKKKEVRLEPETTPDEWQTTIMPIVKRAQQVIFEDAGKDGLDYLHKRGIDDETIREHGIGYIPPVEEWCKSSGLAFAASVPGDTHKLGIPYGITFPYMMDGHIYRLEMRRTPDLIKLIAQLQQIPEEEVEKIAQVRGCKTAIFNADDAASKDHRRDILFTEGVIDAMSINQTVGRWCNDEIKAVTFGAATTMGDANAFYKWYVMPYRVIVGLDNDDSGRTNGERLAEEITRARQDAGRSTAKIAFPPEQYKDWNEFLLDKPGEVFEYISILFPETEYM